MTALAWTQAFFDGNRRTGIVAADKFLADNGYVLLTDSKGENAELREMLKEIKKYQRDLNPDVFKRFVSYVSKRVKSTDPEDEKVTDEIIKRHSNLLAQLATDD